MTTDKSLPTIYASIGSRDDVNTHPTSRTAVASVLSVSGESERLDRITHLEQAVREALSAQFLADSLREWAHEHGKNFVDCSINTLADEIAKKSL